MGIQCKAVVAKGAYGTVVLFGNFDEDGNNTIDYEVDMSGAWVSDLWEEEPKGPGLWMCEIDISYVGSEDDVEVIFDNCTYRRLTSQEMRLLEEGKMFENRSN